MHDDGNDVAGVGFAKFGDRGTQGAARVGYVVDQDSGFEAYFAMRVMREMVAGGIRSPWMIAKGSSRLMAIEIMCFTPPSSGLAITAFLTSQFSLIHFEVLGLWNILNSVEMEREMSNFMLSLIYRHLVSLETEVKLTLKGHQCLILLLEYQQGILEESYHLHWSFLVS